MRKVLGFLNRIAAATIGAHVCEMTTGEAKVVAGVAVVTRTCKICGKQIQTILR